jgi:hypothetical protein
MYDAINHRTQVQNTEREHCTGVFNARQLVLHQQKEKNCTILAHKFDERMAGVTIEAE